MRFDALNNQQNIPCKISNSEWSMGPFHSESGKGFHEKSHRGRGYSYKSDATKSAIFLRVTCFLNNPYAKLCLMLEVHNEDT